MKKHETTTYSYDELDERAKEKARDWYRTGALEYEWWEGVYEDAADVGDLLGIDLRQKRVRCVDKSTRHEPQIYFNGFGCQSQGSSYMAIWCAKKVQVKALKAHAPTDVELHQIVDSLAQIGMAYPSARAIVSPNNGGTSVTVGVELGYDESDYADEETAQHNAQTQQEAEENLVECLEDFNHWIFRMLEREYDWLLSDEQVEDSIKANSYEFLEDGEIF